MDDVLKGNWKQLKGEVKQWWGELTDDDLTMIDGQRDKLIGTLQTRYGWARNRAETEVDERLSRYQKPMHDAQR